MTLNQGVNIGNGNEKLPFKVKFAYGLSGYSSFITWTIFSFYGLYFFTDIIGFSAGFAAGIITLGTLWDAISDPIIGVISDNIKSEKGRRRPLIIGVMIPFVIVSILLFTDLGLSGLTEKVYFIAIILLYYTCQTILDIASSALGSEMTMDYDERSTLATMKNFFCMLVILIASPTLVLVDYFGKFFENVNLGWAAALAIYMVVAIVCILILWSCTKGYERFKNEEKFEIKSLPRVFKENKAIRYVMVMFALGVFANTVNLTMQVFFYSYNLELSEGQISTIMMVSGIACCVGAFVIDYLCKKLSKKMAWVFAIGLLVAGYIVIIGFLSTPGNVWVQYIFQIIISLGICSIYQVPWSMIPDCVEVNELQSGQRIEGILFGFTAFIQKISAAIAISVTGIGMEMVGYVANGIQTESTLFGLKMMFLFAVSIPFIISIIVAVKYPLSSELHKKLLKAIEDKKNGISFDKDQFKKIM